MARRERTFHVRIRAKDRDAFRQVPLAQMDIGCMGGLRPQADGAVALEAIVSETLLKKLRAARFDVRVLADIAEQQKKKARPVAPGNRFGPARRYSPGAGAEGRAGEPGAGEGDRETCLALPTFGRSPGGSTSA